MPHGIQTRPAEKEPLARQAGVSLRSSRPEGRKPVLHVIRARWRTIKTGANERWTRSVSTDDMHIMQPPAAKQAVARRQVLPLPSDMRRAYFGTICSDPIEYVLV